MWKDPILGCEGCRKERYLWNIITAHPYDKESPLSVPTKLGHMTIDHVHTYYLILYIFLCLHLFLNHIFFYFNRYITNIKIGFIKYLVWFRQQVCCLFSLRHQLVKLVYQKSNDGQNQWLQSLMLTGQGPVFKELSLVAYWCLPKCCSFNLVFESDFCGNAPLWWRKGVMVTVQL